MVRRPRQLLLLLAASGTFVAGLAAGRMSRQAGGTPASLPPPDDNKSEEFVRELLAETRQELEKADLKATTLFAAFSVVAGLAAVAYSAGVLGALDWTILPGLVFLLGGATAVSLAVWPRVGRGTPGRVDYFADVVLTDAMGMDLATILRGEAENLFARHARELAVLSRAAARKYSYIRRGMLLLAAGILYGVVTAAYRVATQ